jgi:fused signal recognition particle receptor
VLIIKNSVIQHLERQGNRNLMGLFWRRKGKDQFVTLGLNEPPVSQLPNDEPVASPGSSEQGRVINEESPPALVEQPLLKPVAPGTGPTPISPQIATETRVSDPLVTPKARAESTQAKPPVREDLLAQKAVPSRSPFATSILGLNLSIEDLQAQEAALEQEFSARFRRAVAATRESLSDRLDTVFQGLKQIDENLLDELEEALIAADIGVATTQHILETVRRGIARKQINDLEALKQAIKNELIRILRASESQGVASETKVPENVLPYVMMIVGVNGVGKTTTIGKLAQRIKAEGNDVLICAADTFRAAASDQLAIWAERTGVPLIQQKQGTDPAAVLFDSLKAAKSRGSDVLIVDTAGRLHNKSNLMAELEKMKRVAGREVQGAPHETLLVVDAVTGQNGLEQARQFLKVAGVTGIVLTKLDGTAKGGIAVAIANELNLPIRYVGIGEKVDDLMLFDPELYVNGLFE